jgi:hypothetical protein
MKAARPPRPPPPRTPSRRTKPPSRPRPLSLGTLDALASITQNGVSVVGLKRGVAVSRAPHRDPLPECPGEPLLSQLGGSRLRTDRLDLLN